MLGWLGQSNEPFLGRRPNQKGRKASHLPPKQQIVQSLSLDLIRYFFGVPFVLRAKKVGINYRLFRVSSGRRDEEEKGYF